MCTSEAGFQHSSKDVEEADKSYVYSIDWRGRVLTDEAGVTEAVEAVGVTTPTLDLMRVPHNGEAKSSSMPVKLNGKPNTWLPRRAFLRALHGGLAEAERSGRVALLHSTKLVSVHLAPPLPPPGSGGGAAEAPATQSQPPHPVLVRSVETDSGRERLFAPRLLVGADGAHSDVRCALEEWAPGAGMPAEQFRPVVLDSPAAGLRYKVLQLPPSPPFRRPAAAAAPSQAAVEAGRLENRKFAMVQGRPGPRRRVMRLGLLPIADPAAPRTANFISTPDHEFWSIKGGEQLRDFLQDAFPQLDIPALLTPQQLEAAAAASGGAFPRPQYLRRFTAVLPSPFQTPGPAPKPTADGHGISAAGGSSPGGGSGSAVGVALVGDAVHCFPPDLGQGVNSAMLDVVGLAQALDEAAGDVGKALPMYEARRAPEAAALTHLVTFSYPYQYNQAPLRRALWTANFLIRSVLSRLLPNLFSGHSFILVQQPGLSYAEILELAHATTRRLWALAGVVATAVIALALRMALAAA
ncbi:hypothetical protein GPECTOR_18g73 [Gonium pectorale]|uniref:FAD-binding domain-containing protein n=1 Tax=Gonium pectorale TaxID=33097 RepID=A0A150GK03_GONPE|nr:hypothetical protein GPECTOR_18g73 [Gonium pectorale]|eukprot:KXZ50097.1 hypothetical protein GPECTOR_18g73 [Gonium pectorale]